MSLMLSEMKSSEFTEWMAYFEVEAENNLKQQAKARAEAEELKARINRGRK